jgi:hypothetical protein
MRRRTLGIIVVGGALLAAPLRAAAETRYVSKTGTDWSTTCDQANPCASIRMAVQNANAGDTIAVGPGLFVESDTIVIDKPLTIEGAGPDGTIVQPLTQVRVFEISNIYKASYAVGIRSLTVRFGKGIRNDRTLTLENVVLHDHVDAGVINGNNGTIRLHRVRSLGNEGAGFDNFPGGFALVTESEFSGNAGTPGGIDNGGYLFMHQSLVAGNVGEHVAGIGNTGLMYLTNVTISGNTAAEVVGRGGIALAKGEAYLTHVTITGNQGGLAGGVSTGGGGKVDLRNTIVSGNSLPECRIHYNGISPDGDITGAGNLVGDNSCNLWPAGPGGTGSGNLLGGDPGLLPLGDYGGETPTHALLPGSLAIDAGYLQFCLKADQRGVARPIDGDQDGETRCDIGAYEFSFDVGGGSRDGRAYWHYRGQWFRRGPSNHIGRGAPDRRDR